MAGSTFYNIHFVATQWNMIFHRNTLKKPFLGNVVSGALELNPKAEKRGIK